MHGDGRPIDRKTGQQLSRIRAVLGFDRLLPGDQLRSTRQLGRGHHLLLRPAGLAAEAGAPWVVEAQDDHALVVTPLLSDSSAPIDSWQPGIRVQGHYPQGRDVTYGFATHVLGVELAARRLLLRHTQHVERVQQRSFFRLSTRFPIVLLVGEGAASLDLEQASRLQGTVVDISGGGLSVRLAETPAESAELTVDPAFTGPFPLAGVKCEVVAAVERDECVHLRLCFVELSGRVETSIVRGIYQRQLGTSPPLGPQPAERLSRRRPGR